VVFGNEPLVARAGADSLQAQIIETPLPEHDQFPDGWWRTKAPARHLRWPPRGPMRWIEFGLRRAPGGADGGAWRQAEPAYVGGASSTSKRGWRGSCLASR